MEKTTKPSLSVAILARNCARAVVETIHSVRAIAAEIVVLDTGSTDDTLVAALQAGAAVHRRTWDDDFAAARNACLDIANSDWILWLDAGETLAADQAGALREFLNGALPWEGEAPAEPNSYAAQQELRPSATKAHPAAFSVTIALPPAGGQIGGEAIERLRLHRRIDGLRFAGRVRESLHGSLAKLNLAAQPLPIVVQRPLRDHDPEVRAAKAQRNIRLADQQLAEQGPSADIHNCLGEALQVLADAARAGQHFRRAIELATPGSPEQLEAYYGLLTCLDGASADRGPQLALCMEALEKFPLDAQLLVALGGYLQALEQPELARRAYDVAFRHGQIEPRLWHLPEIRQIAAACAATVLQQAGNDAEAITLLEAAVRSLPQSVRLARQLIEMYVKHRRRDEALALLRTCQATDPGNPQLATLAADVQQQLGRPTTPEPSAWNTGPLRLDLPERPAGHVGTGSMAIAAAEKSPV
jgi:tetratricopeptide (TPR) repeat protein